MANLALLCLCVLLGITAGQRCDPSAGDSQCWSFEYPHAFCDKGNGICTPIGCKKNSDCRHEVNPWTPVDPGATCDVGVCRHSVGPKPSPGPGPNTCGARCASAGDCSAPCDDCAGSGATHPGQWGVCRGNPRAAASIREAEVLGGSGMGTVAPQSAATKTTMADATASSLRHSSKSRQQQQQQQQQQGKPVPGRCRANVFGRFPGGWNPGSLYCWILSNDACLNEPFFKCEWCFPDDPCYPKGSPPS